ncbi:PREDICTED: cytochrome P450 71A14-like [Camelina sativa]|uniref:Cytochrome P450 71A14-like n=1 Tax=Camelina sativa TaxID=90675 RepID=A0ABM0YJ81_CAMSA|nr:PREDICTED: cytochrome P450 71A14-like [Camelina sativa]
MGKLKKASSSSSSVNLSEILMTLANDIICRVSLGRKYSVEESGIDVKSTMKEIMELLGTFPLGEYIPSLACIDRFRGVGDKMDEVNNKFNGFVERVVQEHIDADKGRSDFVDILLSIQRDKSLPDFDRKNLKLILWEMFIAGTTTTSSTLEWRMTMLIKYPECMRKLQEERHFDSPLDFKGQHFMYIPFGSGRRMCPGVGFGVALVEVTLANLVKRYNWRVQSQPSGDEYDLAEAASFELSSQEDNYPEWAI